MTSVTMQVPPAPANLAGRIRGALADGLTVVRRDLRHLKYQPGELVGALVFPALMVLLFGYVFGSAISVPGGNYREYLMPGLFAMTAFTGLIATTVIVAGDAAKGVMDRFRSMPMARLAVPFGQTGADALTGTLALAIMVGCGLALGWRPHARAGGGGAGAGPLHPAALRGRLVRLVHRAEGPQRGDRRSDCPADLPDHDDLQYVRPDQRHAGLAAGDLRLEPGQRARRRASLPARQLRRARSGRRMAAGAPGHGQADVGGAAAGAVRAVVGAQVHHCQAVTSWSGSR